MGSDAPSCRLTLIIRRGNLLELGVAETARCGGMWTLFTLRGTAEPWLRYEGVDAFILFLKSCVLPLANNVSRGEQLDGCNSGLAVD